MRQKRTRAEKAEQRHVVLSDPAVRWGRLLMALPVAEVLMALALVEGVGVGQM